MMIIETATKNDVDSWLELLKLVEEHFPGLDYSEYLSYLRKAIEKSEALTAKENDILIGAVIFSLEQNELAFLAVHPQYRNQGVAKELVNSVLNKFSDGETVEVVTYREHDKMGTMARNFYKSLGFVSGGLITVFDYPCEKFMYKVKR